MAEHVPSGLYIFSEEGQGNLEWVRENPYGTQITPVSIDTLRGNEIEYLEDCGHVVVCGPLAVIKEVMHFGMEYHFSIGFIPLPTQISLLSCYGLPKDPEEILSLALSSDPKDLDIVLCNDQILLFKGRIGRIPLVDYPENTNKAKIIFRGLKRITSLELLPFTITTKGKNKSVLSTAICGCMLFVNPERSFASSLIAHDSSFSDGMVSMVLVAPISVIDYFRLMFRTLVQRKSVTIPDSIGHIKSPHILFQSERELNVLIDGESTTKTPVECRVIPGAIKINHGKDPEVESKRSRPGREKFATNTLPVGKELEKAQNKKIPFFTYASEERFKDLFVALRDDAINHENDTSTTLFIVYCSFYYRLR